MWPKDQGWYGGSNMLRNQDSFSLSALPLLWLHRGSIWMLKLQPSCLYPLTGLWKSSSQMPCSSQTMRTASWVERIQCCLLSMNVFSLLPRDDSKPRDKFMLLKYNFTLKTKGAPLLFLVKGSLYYLQAVILGYPIFSSRIERELINMAIYV